MSRSKQHDRNRRNAIEGGRGKGREHPDAALTRAHQVYNRGRKLRSEGGTEENRWLPLQEFRAIYKG